jgi:hypothetical protein
VILKSRTLSRTSDTTETRNPCVIKVILLVCFTMSKNMEVTIVMNKNRAQKYRWFAYCFHFYWCPEAGHFLCIRNSRQNVKQQLIDDCIDKNDRESLLEEIFGDEGLINADDIVCFAPPLKAANKSPNTCCCLEFLMHKKWPASGKVDLMAFTKAFSSSDPIVNWFVLAPKSLIFKWWKKWVKLWKSLLSWIKIGPKNN